MKKHSCLKNIIICIIGILSLFSFGISSPAQQVCGKDGGRSESGIRIGASLNERKLLLFRVYTRQEKPAVSVRGWPKIKTRQPVRHPRRV